MCFYEHGSLLQISSPGFTSCRQILHYPSHLMISSGCALATYISRTAGPYFLAQQQIQHISRVHIIGDKAIRITPIIIGSLVKAQSTRQHTKTAISAELSDKLLPISMIIVSILIKPTAVQVLLKEPKYPNLYYVQKIS